MRYTIALIFLCTLFSNIIKGQNDNFGEKPIIGKYLFFKLCSAPFPHPEREAGIIYGNKIYSAEECYQDSTVLVFIPEDFNSKDSINFVLYFHGWRNNIDNAVKDFHLIEQFIESRVNAIFVFPEVAKNAPDSFAGKMEDESGLKNLLNELMDSLFVNEYIKHKKIGSIILAGHSGAYQAMGMSLKHGGYADKILDVLLFDALYDVDLFKDCFPNLQGRFINVCTNYGGGTKEKSERLINYLSSNKVLYLKTMDSELTMSDLLNNQLIFIHSNLRHDEVVFKRNQFRDFLISSKVPKIN